MFREGMKPAGRGALDDAIAVACAKVHGDEFEHKLAGIAGLARCPLSPDEWTLLRELTTAQMRQRIHMRNAQFGNLQNETRISEILAGDIEPVPFDHELAARLLV